MIHPDTLAQKDKITEYLQTLGIKYKDTLQQNIFLTAFIHKSFAADYKEDYVHNERLEFLGDGILWAIINKLLFINFPDFAESKLTLHKIALVREETLAEVARDINLWSQIFISRWEEKSNGRDKDSILSDTFEALIAAIFLELGFDMTEDFVKRYVYIKLKKISLEPIKSYKTLIQELVQKEYKQIPEYRDSEYKVSPTGNIDQYQSTIYISWEKKSEWFGISKKKAQEAAAKALYLQNKNN